MKVKKNALKTLITWYIHIFEAMSDLNTPAMSRKRAAKNYTIHKEHEYLQNDEDYQCTKPHFLIHISSFWDFFKLRC